MIQNSPHKLKIRNGMFQKVSEHEIKKKERKCLKTYKFARQLVMFFGDHVVEISRDS